MENFTFYAFNFSAVLLGPGNKVKEMALKPIARWASLFCFIATIPQNPSSPWRKEEKADKRQNNVSGKIEFSCILYECQGWVAPGAGNQCLWQIAESFIEEDMQHNISVSNLLSPLLQELGVGKIPQHHCEV